MRRSVWMFVVVLAVSALMSAPLQASSPGPTDEVWTYYMDCALNHVGWHTRICSGTNYQGGTQGGVYRLQEWGSCTEPIYEMEYQWSEWNGSAWVEIDPPEPSC